MGSDAAWNRDWIESELRALRELVQVEKDHVAQRFTQVNELREQVLQERGVFVRHEALNSLGDRLAHVEQVFIARADHEALIGRVVMMERQAITRAEFEGLARRISKLEALGPVIALITGVVGALMGYFIAHLYGLK